MITYRSIHHNYNKFSLNHHWHHQWLTLPCLALPCLALPCLLPSPPSSHSSLLTTPPSSPASGVSLNEFLPPHFADLNTAVVASQRNLVGTFPRLITPTVSSVWRSSWRGKHASLYPPPVSHCRYTSISCIRRWILEDYTKLISRV